jgi:hypothetical protein
MGRLRGSCAGAAGFVLDDERLKLNNRFGKDYFDELLERIREIRASERRSQTDFNFGIMFRYRISPHA